MSTSSLRRQVKNIVRNYSEAEVKVREATSNDPWGPSTALMGEIADLTYNVTAFAEIMGMLWRRLNDHGRNWRHVYKALALAEYLVKTGSERVARQCRENVYAVQTLRDFQYVDRDGRDQGVNVREKAKQLVALLKDDARLQEERAQALRTKEKLAQASAVLASAPAPAPAPAPSASMGPLASGAPMEQAWPQSTGEEELQLQLALAMSKEEAQQQRSPEGPAEDLQMQLALTLSKEEHDKEERLRRGDDLRLQMAIEESQRQNVGQASTGEPSLMELADIFTTPSASGPPASNDPWGAPPPAPAVDPWGAPTPAGTPADPWGAGPVHGTPAPLSDSWDILGAQPTPPVPVDSWATLPPSGHQPAPTLDPWVPLSEPLSDTAPPAAPSQSYETLDAKADDDDFAAFDSLRATPVTFENSAGEPDLLAGEVPVLPADGVKTQDLFDLSPVEAPSSKPIPAARKTPESFLGLNAALVDLDALVSSNVKASNPFLSTGGSTPSSGTNPFGGAPPTQSLSLNQLRASPVLTQGALSPSLAMSPLGAPPLLPAPSVMPTPVAVPVPLNGFGPHPSVPVTTTTNPFLL